MAEIVPASATGFSMPRIVAHLVDGVNHSRCASTLADELRDEAGLETLDALLAAVPALLHATERRLGHRDLEAVEPDHARLDALAEQVDSPRVVREAERRETERQPVRLA